MLSRGFAEHDLRRFEFIAPGSALLIALALIFAAPKAHATPTFARQTGRNCSFCHSGPPRLNDTGLAFKNHGFRFPNSDEAPDKDRKDAPAQ